MEKIKEDYFENQRTITKNLCPKWLWVVLCVVILGGLSFAIIKIKKTPANNSASKNTADNGALTVFKPDESLLNFTSTYQEENVALSKISNYEAVKTKYGLTLTDSQEKSLDQNKFLLVDLNNTSFKSGDNFDQMLTDFDKITGGDIYNRKPEDTKLVTPDVVLQAYHRYFELTLEQLEKNELGKTLGDFIDSLHDNLATAVKNSSGDSKTHYQTLEAQIVLARVLFENKNAPKPDSFKTAEEETAYNTSDKTIDTATNAKTILAKYSADLTPELISAIETDIDQIYAASAVGSSPLFSQYTDNLQTDYTQYTPRSHYTETSSLRAYFRTMMYLGRSSYYLEKDAGIIDSNLLAKQFSVKSSNGTTPLESWNKIMTVTGFYAGQSDDLTYTEWQAYETKVLSSNTSDSDLSSSANVAKLAQDLNQLRLPKIFSDVVVDENIASETKADLLRKSLSFKIFGQKFTFDAWILNDLTAGQEQTDVKLPSTPSALFVPAAMGDAQAKNYTEEFLQKDAGFSTTEVGAFLTKLAQKIADIAKIKKEEWFNSMGSAWLYALGSLTHSYGKNYPLYMQSAAFSDKQIQTFLGSYTELKHDTLLYAKQSYAERGGGGEPPPIPPVVKGFVEPNMDFWNRFQELLSQTDQFFAKNDLMANSTSSARLQEFEKDVSFYSNIAKAELQSAPISDDDYEKLRTTSLTFMADPLDTSVTEPDENSGKVALIADIHTDTVKQKILYEATGKPYLMLAVVANEQTPRVVASLVYNHYEYTGDLGKRLTDQDWQKLVYDQPNSLPLKNFWYQSLLAK